MVSWHVAWAVSDNLFWVTDFELILLCCGICKLSREPLNMLMQRSKLAQAWLQGFRFASVCQPVYLTKSTSDAHNS